MTNKDVFLTQWNKLSGEMAEVLQSQLQGRGTANAQELLEAYHAKLLRWQSDMNAEGRWFARLEQVQAEVLLESMKSVKLPDIPLNRRNAGKPFAWGVVVGAAVAAISSVLLKRSTLISLIIAVVAGAAVFAILTGNESSRRRSSVASAVSEYKQKFTKIGEELAKQLKDD